MLANPLNWRVPWPRPAGVPLFSLGLEVPRSLSHVATAGGCQRLLTHYRRREVRNSIYRYRKIYIDYRSKFSYRFISSISIIYGNTSHHQTTKQVKHGVNGWRCCDEWLLFVNTQNTLSWVHNKFITPVHALFFIYWTVFHCYMIAICDIYGISKTSCSKSISNKKFTVKNH